MSRNKDSNIVFVIKVLVLISIILFSSWKLFTEIKQYSDSQKLYDEVAENVIKNVSIKNEEVSSGENKESKPEDTSSNKEIEVDFKFLKNINSDIVAWIRRDDEKINYPVVQGENNDFYLYRSINKSKNKCGSIFMDYKNDEEFSDDITLIYGHNMKDGSMFASLKDYQDGKDIDSLPDLNVYTPVGSKKIDIKYVFFHSGYEGIETNFKSDEAWENYIEKLESDSIYKSEEKPDRSDRLLALVTCEYVFDNARLVVLGKLSG